MTSCHPLSKAVISLSALLLLTLPLLVSASNQATHAHGVHGMVLFGSDSLFASHLPLYRAPHDWQVVLEVEPQDQAVAESFRQSDGMLTIEPEPFDLTRLDPQAEDPLPAFAAKVYKGHFERGGELWLECHQLQVHRLAHRQKIRAVIRVKIVFSRL